MYIYWKKISISLCVYEIGNVDSFQLSILLLVPWNCIILQFWILLISFQAENLCYDMEVHEIIKSEF